MLLFGVFSLHYFQKMKEKRISQWQHFSALKSDLHLKAVLRVSELWLFSKRFLLPIAPTENSVLGTELVTRLSRGFVHILHTVYCIAYAFEVCAAKASTGRRMEGCSQLILGVLTFGAKHWMKQTNKKTCEDNSGNRKYFIKDYNTPTLSNSHVKVYFLLRILAFYPIRPLFIFFQIDSSLFWQMNLSEYSFDKKNGCMSFIFFLWKSLTLLLLFHSPQSSGWIFVVQNSIYFMIIFLVYFLNTTFIMKNSTSTKEYEIKNSKLTSPPVVLQRQPLSSVPHVFILPDTSVHKSISFFIIHP